MIEYVNAIARLWWGWTSAMFWQVGLLIVLIACIDRLIRRWAWPQLRYALWSLILIKLILPPTLSLPSGAVPQLAPVVGQAVRWMDSEATVVEESPVLRSFRENAVSVAAMEPARPMRAAVAAEWIPTDVGTPMLVERNGQEFRPPYAAARAQNHPQASLEAATPVEPRLLWQVYAMAMWLAGTLVLGIWLLLRLHSLVGRGGDRSVSTDGTSLPQSFYSQMAGCAERLGLRRLPRVIVVRRLATPAVFGVFRPVLLMPQGYLSKLSRRDTEHMLLHELAHIQRGDLRTHGLYMLLQVLYWYNPLLWLVRRQLHHLRELSCDATVAELLRERTKAYRKTLLETARRFLATSTEPGLGLLGLFEDANRLVVRLDWLAKPTWRYRTMKRAFVLAVVSLMFACVLPMAQGQDSTPPVVEDQTSNSTDDQGQPSDEFLQELEARLKQLEIERDKLQKELEALLQAKEKVKKARAHSVDAAVEADKAKEEAIRAHIKAQETQAQAIRTYMNEQEYQQWAQEMQAWAEQIQNWQKAMEQWQNSDEWKWWQEDMQKWGQEYGDAFGKAYGGAEGSAGALPGRPVLPMPPAPTAPHPIPHPMPMPVLPAMPEVHVPAMPHIEVNTNVDARSNDNTAKAEETMHFTSPLADGGLLIVENRVGAINVHGAATNECRIDIKVTTWAKTQEEAQALAKTVTMKVENTDARFFIRPVKPDDNDWSDLDVAFEITVPHHVNLQLTTDIGHIYLCDVQGQIKVKANVGGIKTENVRGDIELETNVGDVDFIASDDLSAKLTATTNIGSIKSDLPIQIRSSGNPGPGGVNLSLGKTAVGTLGAGEGTVLLKSNVGSISVRSKASDDKPAKVKPMSSSHAASASVTTGDAFDAHRVQATEESQEGDQYVLRRTELETVPLLPGSVLNVINENGTVTVRGTDGKGCSVQAIFTLEALTAEAAKQLSKTVSLDLTPMNKGLTVATVTPEKMPADHSCRVDLLILVPRRTDPNIANGDGDVQIINLDGQIKLNLEDGNVLCERLAGDLNFRIEDGQLKIHQSAFASCRVAMEDGTIACDGVTGNLDLGLEDGQISIAYGDQVPETCAIKVTVGDGSIRLSAPGEMFPSDDSAKVRTTEDGAEWKTVVATAQGTRAVTLRTEDGSVKVDRR